MLANVLGAIDNVVDYHHVAKRQKDTISKGILTDLSVYIRSLKEVEAAVAFFSANNPDSPELNRVKVGVTLSSYRDTEKGIQS